MTRCPGPNGANTLPTTRRQFLRNAGAGFGMVALSAMLAQEGHPLTGTWHGDYGTSPTQRTPVVFLMHWDSKKVEGKANPGANSTPRGYRQSRAVRTARRGRASPLPRRGARR